MAANFIKICLEICSESEAVQEAYGRQLDDLAPWLGMQASYDSTNLGSRIRPDEN
jgi:hypothetical protein